MNREKISSIMIQLENTISNCGSILKEYAEREKRQISGYIFPLIPPEITSAFGIESVKLPESVIMGEQRINVEGSIYKTLILPEKEMPCLPGRYSGIPVYYINYPGGYGEDAAVQIHNETADMLSALFTIDLKSIDISELQKRTKVFETLRRSVRTIMSLQNEKKGALNFEELDLILEISAIFPPEISLKYISPLIEELQNFQSEPEEYKAKALIYGARKIPSYITGFIESRRIYIAEDDTCRGRRLFDISLNAESEYIFYELLDAYSYRPMSPCIRTVEERYELLYKLLRNYGINLLIFFIDDICGVSAEAVNYLRIRCMRDGIDPLVINRENYKDAVEDYAEKI